MPKKILIHTRNLQIPGGKQSYLIALEDHLKSDITYFFYGTQIVKKETTWEFLKRFFGDYVKFHRLIKNGNFDVVHINTSFNKKSYFRDSIFTFISCRLKVKTIVFWHGWRWDFENKIARKIQWYFHKTFGKADAMVLLAKEFMDQIRFYGYKKKVYLETTVIEDDIMQLADQPQSLKALQPFKSPTVILFLSRIEIAKGIYETIDSFHKILEKFPDTIFNIGGTGSELEKVKTYVSNKAISNIYFKGWISGIDKIKAIQESDIFVLASYSEGMPIAILEAMAGGLSVVTTDVGGVKDFFEDRKMGLVVKKKNTKDLTQKFDQLLADPAWRKQIGEYNIDYAKKKFAAVQVAKRLENIYNEVFDEKNSKVETEV